MNKILISILSDYLQPNFLLIKEFEDEYDALVFITSKEMSKKHKGRILAQALDIDYDSVTEIEVVEDDYSEIIELLEDQDFSKDDEYILNITGGTKVMPVALCDFFKDFDASFFYVPIGKNIIKNIYSDETIDLQYRMNLFEYFTLNGLTIEPNNNFTYDESFTNQVFADFKRVHFNRFSYDKILNYNELPEPQDRKYYSGEWFEDYCYFRLKREMNLDDEFICKNVKIYRAGSAQNDNEVDVMFIKDNQLYIFECKVSMHGAPSLASASHVESMKDSIDNYMYKLAAIAKDYGFRPKSYILTLHNVKYSRRFSESAIENINKRLNILGISGLFDSSDFKRNKPLIEYFEKSETKQQNDDKSVKEISFKFERPNFGIKVVGKIDLSNFKK